MSVYLTASCNFLRQGQDGPAIRHPDSVSATADPVGDVRRRDGGSSRNATRSKTVLTEVGPVEIALPRDRHATFPPATVPKRQRRLQGVDVMVISLCAKGLTIGEIAAPLAGDRSLLARCRQRRFAPPSRLPAGIT
jgi:hypothetical protein